MKIKCILNQVYGTQEPCVHSLRDCLQTVIQSVACLLLQCDPWVDRVMLSRQGHGVACVHWVRRTAPLRHRLWLEESSLHSNSIGCAQNSVFLCHCNETRTRQSGCVLFSSQQDVGHDNDMTRFATNISLGPTSKFSWLGTGTAPTSKV